MDVKAQRVEINQGLDSCLNVEINCQKHMISFVSLSILLYHYTTLLNHPMLVIYVYLC